MKPRFILLLSILIGARISVAAEATAPGCCNPVTDVKPSCCSGEKVAVGKPLTDRSIYQLDSAWVNDAGKTLALTALRGRPVIVAMFFAQCEYACPVIVQDIKRLRGALPPELRDKVQLLLVTFDTERDTPTALRAFRERMTLDAQWTLLRGEAAPVQELAMLLGVKFKRDARGQFAHSNILTLLNAEGEIIHQHAGLNGDISEAARALTVAAR